MLAKYKEVVNSIKEAFPDEAASEGDDVLEFSPEDEDDDVLEFSPEDDK